MNSGKLIWIFAIAGLIFGCVSDNFSPLTNGTTARFKRIIEKCQQDGTVYRVTNFEYDSKGNKVIEVKRYSPLWSGATDSTIFEYDDKGLLDRETNFKTYKSNIVAWEKKITEFKYNDYNDRVYERTIKNYSNGVIHQDTIVYDYQYNYSDGKKKSLTVCRKILLKRKYF
jgi:hypothetical protein